MLENSFVQFMLGFVLLWSGAWFLVRGTEEFAKKFNFSPFVASFVLIGFATSSPEIFISIISSFEGDSSIAIGNAIGSNIANVLFVLAICFLFLPQNTKMIDFKSPNFLGYDNKKSITIFFLILILLTFISFSMLLDHELSKNESVIVIFAFFIIVYLLFFLSKNGEEQEKLQSSSIKIFINLLLGLSVIVFGTELLLSGANAIAKSIGVSAYIIGLSMTAIGTSLPELATGLECMRKKNYSFVAGNILGSNIFNMGIVLGLAGLIHPAVLEADYLQRNIIMIVLSTFFMYVFFTCNRSKIMYSSALVAIFIYVYYQTGLYGI